MPCLWPSPERGSSTAARPGSSRWIAMPVGTRWVWPGSRTSGASRQARRSRPAEPGGRVRRQRKVAADARVEDADLEFLHAPIIPVPARFATHRTRGAPAQTRAHAHQGLAAGRAAARKTAGARLGRLVRGGAARDLAAARHERHERARPRAFAAACASVRSAACSRRGATRSAASRASAPRAGRSCRPRSRSCAGITSSGSRRGPCSQARAPRGIT